MSTDAGDDKYPGDSGRRRFVKGVVGGASLAALGTTGAAAINSATSPTGEGGGTTRMFGIENTAGPAPRGMPQIPIEIDDQGRIKGVWPQVKTRTNSQGEKIKVAEMQLGGVTYSSEWFQYCGVQALPGLVPDADQDNFFRSSGSTQYQWQQDIPPNQPLTVSMFDDYKTWGNDIGKSGVGKPALATWRSQDVPSGEELVVQVIRSTKIEELAQGNSQYNQWIDASTQNGFIAWLNKCTHFCCVPGYKTSAQSESFGAANEVYCPCHQSIYDPFNPLPYVFTALPRPESE